MMRRRAEVLAAIALCVALAIVGFDLLNVPVRTWEVAVVSAVIGHGGTVSVVPHHTFQVLPAHHAPFRAHVTPFCSSLVSILALAGIGLFLLRGSLLRRVGAVAAAAALIMAGNVLRIAGSLAVGLGLGDGSLVLFHDWVGTLFGLTYTAAGFFFMLWLLLPSAKDTSLVRAARVSDVL
ncbi:MAG: exosortase/archaeosortase family protein [Frankiaceae bacterium]